MTVFDVLLRVLEEDVEVGLEELESCEDFSIGEDADALSKTDLHWVVEPKKPKRS